MSEFPEPATSVIKNFLTRSENQIGITSITAGPSNDSIYLGQYAQSVHLNGGHDQVTGSNLDNTFFVDPLVNFAEISGKISGWFESGVTQFTLKVTSNNKLLGTVNLSNSSAKNDSNANWSPVHTFQVSIPINSIPKDLELTVSTNNGASFARLSDLKLYWLGETSLNISEGKNIGNFNLQLSTQNPEWIFSGGGKIFQINTSNLLDRVAGKSSINGEQGIDSVVFPSGKINFTLLKISESLNTFFIKEKDTYTPDVEIKNIERILFSDAYLAIDLNGNAGTTAKILGAVFGKESVANKNYVGIGLHFLDSGWTYDNLAGLALDAAGAKTNDQIVSLLWTNVIGTKPTAADKQPFIKLLENGMTAGALAHLAADTAFNITNINLVGLAQTGIEYIPV
jgi:hypothetical protein